MNLSNVWIIALAGLTAAGIATWIVLAVGRVMEELRTFSFEGMHFEE
jgi:hypothetical protein